MAVISPDNHGLRLAVRYAVLVLIAVIFIFPLIFMVMSSLKPAQQLLADTSSLRAFLPVGDISLDNYAAAFRRAPVSPIHMPVSPFRRGRKYAPPTSGWKPIPVSGMANMVRSPATRCEP